MRPKERIPIFIKHVNIRQLITDWFKNQKLPNLSMSKVIKEITTKILYLTQYWQDNPDLRFSQVLINTGLLPNIPGTWFYETDTEILIKQGCQPRDIILWGKNFDKEGNRLPKTEWILIKDLPTDHIKNILISEFHYLDPPLTQCFENELELRKEIKKRAKTTMGLKDAHLDNTRKKNDKLILNYPII